MTGTGFEFLGGFNFLDFEFEIDGPLRTTVAEAAKLAGVKPVDLIRQALELRFGQLRDDEVKARTTINDGNNGFHILTIVTDGYGNLLTENAYGKEQATVKWEEHDDDPAGLKGFSEVLRKTAVNQAHAAALAEDRLKCDQCGKYKVDVSVRPDGYAQDIHNEKDATYTACDDCDYNRLQDI